MAKPRPGDNIKKFMTKGFQSFSPLGMASKASLLALLVAGPVGLPTAQAASDPSLNTALSQSYAIHQAIPPSADQALPGVTAPLWEMSTEFALDHQGLLHDIVSKAAAKYSQDTTYPIDNLSNLMMAYIHVVQETKTSGADASVKNLYGLDDDMWAWMMRNHGKEAGLGYYTDGVNVNQDGTLDAKNPAKLAAMLELKNNAAAATRLFAAWLHSEIGNFDGEMGRAPTLGEIAVIALTDSQGGMDAATMAKNSPDIKLAPEIQIAPGSWKRALFADSHRNWLSAKDAMGWIDATMADASKHAFDDIQIRKSEGPQLDEDFTTADLRQNPNRFAKIVANAVNEIPVGDGIFADATREGLAETVLALAATIDEFRGQDTSGGIYALGEGQWLVAAATHGDSAFKSSFMQGIDFHEDGSIHVSDAGSIGTFLRLREHAPIATQIVLAKTMAEIATLQHDLGRSPLKSEVLITHLFGVAAGEEFAHRADSGPSSDVTEFRFSDGDPRNAWAYAFALGNDPRPFVMRAGLDMKMADHSLEARQRLNFHAEIQTETHLPRL